MPDVRCAWVFLFSFGHEKSALSLLRARAGADPDLAAWFPIGIALGGRCSGRTGCTSPPRRCSRSPRSRTGAPGRRATGDERAFGRSRRRADDDDVRARWNSFAARASDTRASRRSSRRRGTASPNSSCRLRRGSRSCTTCWSRPSASFCWPPPPAAAASGNEVAAAPRLGEPESAARATRASGRSASAAAAGGRWCGSRRRPGRRRRGPAHGDQERNGGDEGITSTST